MLSLYGSITVPGVPHVVVYRDDEEPLKFYMVSSKLGILRNTPAEGSDPMLSLVAYVRDLDNMETDDTAYERGQLQVTVGLEVSQQDQKKIRAFLRKQIRRESSRGYRFLKKAVRLGEPILSYAPVCVSGTAKATTFDEELQIAAEGESPTLNTGVSSASFSYALTQSGARFMKQTLDAGALPITVFYHNHMIVARIPAIKINIRGDRREFMKEVERNAVTRTYTTKVHKVNHLGNKVISSVQKTRKVVRIPPSLKEFRSTYQSLTIEIDDGDFRDADPEDNVSEELERLAFTMLENNILPTFFDPAIPSDEAEEDEKEYWLKSESVQGRVNVSIQRRDVVQIAHSPSGKIGGSLSEQEIKDAVTVLDLSKPISTVKNLNIHPNVNFDTDPIFAVRVLIDYNEMEELNHPASMKSTRKDFMFQQGATSLNHRFTLANAADGSVKREYRYRTITTFKNSQQQIEYPENGWFTSSADNLVISYNQFGHVKIDFVLSALPEEVNEVAATVTYPGATLPGSTQTIILTPDNPTASYLYNTQNSDPVRPYKLKLVYKMADGSQIERPEVESTSLVQTISSPFEDRQETTFIARGDFVNELESILVTAKYADSDNDLDEQITLTLNEDRRSDVWAVRQIDKTHDEMSYTVRMFFRNGSERTTQHTGLLGDIITVGPSGSDAIEVMVDAGLVDWSKFARVLVTVDYKDEENDVVLNKRFLFSDMSAQLETWTILIADPGKRELTVTKRFIGIDPADSIDGAPEVTSDPFILLR